MTVAQETGELRNSGRPGNEEFDTLIFGSPPLAYPAALSQYVIYNTPDPAYVTGRINISAFANLGAATPWPFTNANVPLNGHICIPRGKGGRSRSPFSRTATTIHSKTLRPAISICANCWRHTGSSQRRLMSTFSTDPISARTTRGPSFISNT